MAKTNIQYDLSLEERPGYLYAVICSDTIDRISAIEYLFQIAAKATNLGYKNILLRRDIPMMLNDPDLFFTTREFADLMRGKRVAFINPHAVNDETMDFSMVIAKNRGATFMMHPDEGSAIKWLLDPDH